MSKELKEFDVVVMDFSASKVTKSRRSLPKDIQTEELEEILHAEGAYDSDTCSLLFRATADGGVTMEDKQ